VSKNAHVEDKPDVRLKDGTLKHRRFYAVDGAIGLGEVDDKGKVRSPFKASSVHAHR
jgi:hypothetical protein